jgi:DNA-binding Lrp family transcriptional regulator
LIPLIEEKKSQREIAKICNKSLGWVNKQFRKLADLHLIKKKGTTRDSFFVINYFNLKNFLFVHDDFTRGETGTKTTRMGRVHNVTVKFKMLKPPKLKAQKINMTNWAKYRTKYGGIEIEWSAEVKNPYFIVRYPVFYARNFVEAERQILDRSREIALNLSEDYNLKVEAYPTITYGEIAFKGDPVAQVVRKFGNYDNGTIKIDESEEEEEHEYYGAGDIIFKRADDYFDLPERINKLITITENSVKAQEVFAEAMKEHLALIKSLQEVAEALKRNDYKKPKDKKKKYPEGFIRDIFDKRRK